MYGIRKRFHSVCTVTKALPQAVVWVQSISVGSYGHCAAVIHEIYVNCACIIIELHVTATHCTGSCSL
jgi:hypothetical protein